QATTENPRRIAVVAPIPRRQLRCVLMSVPLVRGKGCLQHETTIYYSTQVRKSGDRSRRDDSGARRARPNPDPHPHPHRAQDPRLTSTASPAVSLRIDASTDTGAFTALPAVNNGPISHGGLVTLTEWQSRLDLPAIRLHDSGWPGPVVVDLPMIFPDFH